MSRLQGVTISMSGYKLLVKAQQAKHQTMTQPLLVAFAKFYTSHTHTQPLLVAF